jgi:2-keto-4-pentenoate hydratase
MVGPMEAGAGTSGFADRLWRAEVDREPIAPITDGDADLTIEDAYLIQTHNIERRVAAGRVVCGRKVGLTSRPMQALFGADEPDSGVLLDDMFVDDGDEVAHRDLLAPRVAAGMAFVMAGDLAGPGVTTTHALSAIAAVLPAIEIGDSRIADWRLQLVDAVADNASSGKVAVGGRLTAVTGLDLRLIGVLVHRNGAVIDSGAGAAALGNPARCLAWLANRLGPLGSGLRSGDVVLPGSLHRMVPARPGDVFRADFARLGSVTVAFGAGEAA